MNYTTHKQYEVEDVNSFFGTNSVNHIVFQDGRRYEVHRLVFLSLPSQDEPKYFDLCGQRYPKDEEPISERIAGRVEEIKYLEIQYS